MTNNSSRTTEEIYQHLIEIGYELNKDNIITSSEVTANYILNENSQAKIFLIGMNGIRTELLKHHLEIVEENADYVVIGLDLKINYEKIFKHVKKSLKVLNLFQLIAT